MRAIPAIKIIYITVILAVCPLPPPDISQLLGHLGTKFQRLLPYFLAQTFQHNQNLVKPKTAKVYVHVCDGERS